VADRNDAGREAGAPSPDEFDESEIERIGEFLSKKGGVMLLAELQAEPKRFVVLRDELKISSATIRNRLKDARELGLVSDDPVYNDQGQKCHPLTAKGQVIADELQLTDLARIQKQIWKLEAEFEDRLEEFETTLTQKTTELNDEFQRELTRRYS
jgi:DNA-binding HxlR family transcriptional regulator